MAARDKVSHRYAKAFFDFLGGKAEEVKKVSAELEKLADCVDTHQELARVLNSEVFSTEVRAEIASDLTKKLKLSENAAKLVRLIALQGRTKFLRRIAEQMNLLALEATGIVPLRVHTAQDLTKPQQTKIEQKFSKVLGKEVEARYEVDATLIGGVRVEAAGRTYEGSVAGWLNEFEEALAGV